MEGQGEGRAGQGGGRAGNMKMKMRMKMKMKMKMKMPGPMNSAWWSRTLASHVCQANSDARRRWHRMSNSAKHSRAERSETGHQAVERVVQRRWRGRGHGLRSPTRERCRQRHGGSTGRAQMGESASTESSRPPRSTICGTPSLLPWSWARTSSGK